MGDDIGSGSGCFDFRTSAALHCWVCPLKRSENDLKSQSLSVTEPEPMSSPSLFLTKIISDAIEILIFEVKNTWILLL